MSANFIIDEKLKSKDTILTEYRRVMETPSDLYTVRGAKCQSWVNYLMKDFGLPLGIEGDDTAMHAWVSFARLPGEYMTYFNPANHIDASRSFKNFNWTGEEIATYIKNNTSEQRYREINDGSFLFGFFRKSNYLSSQEVQNAIEKYASEGKKTIMHEQRPDWIKSNYPSLKYTPVTHIGVYINGQYLNLCYYNGVDHIRTDFESVPSFQPVALWSWMKPLREKLGIKEYIF